MRHLVADAIGAPAEREFGEIAGADDDAAMMVGEPEQIVRSQARLHVLERDVVDLLALAEGMADVLQHLRRGGADVELLPTVRNACISASALVLLSLPVAKPGMV